MSFRSLVLATAASSIFALGGVAHAQTPAAAAPMSPGTVIPDGATTGNMARSKIMPAGVGHMSMAGDASHEHMSPNNSMAKMHAGMMMKKDAAPPAPSILNTHDEKSNSSEK
ncbi:hypothetical protein [Acetobacter sp. DsW_063]|uniref:hypothetical protein n=1 Tax=Acetobacter sp. DsW_063 TaxID=1514894 RepID=UPI000A3B7506|nr:hypothetical protein [Acetobacter sp. DsW_063]OUJ14692.1 hypothetical protein HK28_11730 [Acetobacter sp. DsW_063]